MVLNFIPELISPFIQMIKTYTSKSFQGKNSQIDFTASKNYACTLQIDEYFVWVGGEKFSYSLSLTSGSARAVHM
jgi:hypothetical protein